MLIGNHFGKRKPQWNFFLKSYEDFKYSTSAQLIKLLCISFTVQTILFLPVIFWIYQNYSIIESRLPSKLNLEENIQFEKNWIVFLIIGMGLAQCFWNYFVWKTFIKQSYDLNSTAAIPLRPVSHDEVDYQRRVS